MIYVFYIYLLLPAYEPPWMLYTIAVWGSEIHSFPAIASAAEERNIIQEEK